MLFNLTSLGQIDGQKKMRIPWRILCTARWLCFASRITLLGRQRVPDVEISQGRPSIPLPPWMPWAQEPPTAPLIYGIVAVLQSIIMEVSISPFFTSSSFSSFLGDCYFLLSALSLIDLRFGKGALSLSGFNVICLVCLLVVFPP